MSKKPDPYIVEDYQAFLERIRTIRRGYPRDHQQVKEIKRQEKELVEKYKLKA